MFLTYFYYNGHICFLYGYIMNILLIFRLIPKKIEICKISLPINRYNDIDNYSVPAQLEGMLQCLYTCRPTQNLTNVSRLMNVTDIDTLGNCYSNCFVLFYVLRE